VREENLDQRMPFGAHECGPGFLSHYRVDGKCDPNLPGVRYIDLTLPHGSSTNYLLLHYLLYV